MKKKTVIIAAISAVLLAVATVLGVIVLPHTASPISSANTHELLPPLRQTADTLQTHTPAPSPSAGNTSPNDKGNVPSSQIDNGAAFTLHIDGEVISVAYGVDESTLKKTPGMLKSSALPGEEGVCVVYGHRNHLQALQGAEIGDVIIAETAQGSCSYIIEAVRIMDADEMLTIPTAEGRHLMITTCYPFHYSGSAPQKCVVWASFCDENGV